jgi:hypothetical protein
MQIFDVELCGTHTYQCPLQGKWHQLMFLSCLDASDSQPFPLLYVLGHYEHNTWLADPWNGHSSVARPLSTRMVHNHPSLEWDSNPRYLAHISCLTVSDHCDRSAYLLKVKKKKLIMNPISIQEAVNKYTTQKDRRLQSWIVKLPGPISSIYGLFRASIRSSDYMEPNSWKISERWTWETWKGLVTPQLKVLSRNDLHRTKRDMKTSLRMAASGLTSRMRRKGA